MFTLCMQVEQKVSLLTIVISSPMFKNKKEKVKNDKISVSRRKQNYLINPILNKFNLKSIILVKFINSLFTDTS